MGMRSMPEVLTTSPVPGTPRRTEGAQAGLSSAGEGSRRWTRIVAVVVVAALLLSVGLVLRSGQAGSRADIISRFNLRAEIAAQFLGSYVAGTTNQEQRVASSLLSTSTVTQRAFAQTTSTLGFQAAVLLDSRGRLLRVYPNNRALIGSNLANTYTHLRSAVGGEVAISGVVPSAARGVPVVGFAVPFMSQVGSRTYSGAQTLAQTSVGKDYLANFSPILNSTVWLVDSEGQTVASSNEEPTATLDQVDPALFSAIRTASVGIYDGPFGRGRFAAVPVNGTPWRLVLAAPEGAILAPIGGLRLAVPWFVFAGLVLAAGVAGVLQLRLMKLRAQQLADLGLLSLTDPMTGLYNRRGYELVASQLLRDAARLDHFVAMLILDLNGLKTINDTLGHGAGDDAITAAADVLRSTFREADVVARLGGDEFAVVGVLPGDPQDGSPQLRRLQAALDLFNEHEGADWELSLSMGLAIWDPNQPRPLPALEEDADREMYQDKQARGRTRA